MQLLIDKSDSSIRSLLNSSGDMTECNLDGSIYASLAQV